MTTPQLPTDEQLAAWIGPAWETAYRSKFERFRADPRPGLRASWNWRAALFPAWFLAHRLYGVFALLLGCALAATVVTFPRGGDSITDTAFGAIVAGALVYVAFYPVALAWIVYRAGEAPDPGRLAVAAGVVALTIVQGVIADWLLYRKAFGAAGAVAVTVEGAGDTGKRRRRPPSVSPVASGLIVALVSLGGVGAGLLLFTSTMCGCGEKPPVAAMKSDLRNLVNAEEAYFTDSATYTRSLRRLGYRFADTGQTMSPGVTLVIGEANGTGWNATAKHASTANTCGIYVGSASPPIAGQNEGEPRCTTGAPARAPR